jgi:hypothetical protein
LEEKSQHVNNITIIILNTIIKLPTKKKPQKSLVYGAMSFNIIYLPLYQQYCIYINKYHFHIKNICTTTTTTTTTTTATATTIDCRHYC